ncbi:hypothetical protein [Sphingomonas sp. J315]|uniref:hypothetical protein n=1 Tax=Sphingomonas sp. J315 TaxID=2898433 RepID=UPI0021AD8870|nr:hypothetical protein [Sphingomonas sp. J315]UUX98984.1 hypothetical protein LRS08_16005 [Sphingomonas sp. J315]
MAHRIVALDANDPRLDQRLREFADMAELTLANDNESWGLYYYINALHDLHARGLLERAVRPATLATLRQRLDWRRFVRPDLSLINLPNNYYGVAFSIARFRHLLGWEDASAGDQLLARMIDHYRKYSGEYGFADETEGKGRFDRYSVLLIGEIAHRLLETGMTPSDEVKAWLRKSVDLLLLRFNLHGEGFEYGRSIGTYGDTAFLEVLTAAALLKVMTPVEERMAYAFSSRVTARYMDFWIDPVSGSVDMWGRTAWGAGAAHRCLSRRSAHPGGEFQPRAPAYLHQRDLEPARLSRSGARSGIRALVGHAAALDHDLVRARAARSRAGDDPRRQSDDLVADHQRGRGAAYEQPLFPDPLLARHARRVGGRGLPAAAAARHPGRRHRADAARLLQGCAGDAAWRGDRGPLAPDCARPDGGQ